ALSCTDYPPPRPQFNKRRRITSFIVIISHALWGYCLGIMSRFPKFVDAFTRWQQSLEEDQLTTVLQALLSEPAPIHHVAPHEQTGRPAHPRNSIYIAVKTVAALRDDREILIPGPDVGNATGADGALESQFVVVNGVVARFVFAAALGPTALVDQHD